jgi:membrane fusion protein (multidrug efflux system)
LTETRKGALLVPQRAVMELQDGYQVAVAGSDDKVEMRPVKPGERVGNLWIIEEGLKPGERVVAEGLQKVRQGLLVKPRPFVPVSSAVSRNNARPEGGGR